MQNSFCLKAGFFWVKNQAERLLSDFKPGSFLAIISNQKSTKVGLSGSQKMHILSFESGRNPHLHKRKCCSILLEEFSKSDATERL